MKKLTFLLVAAVGLWLMSCQTEPKTGIDGASAKSTSGYPYAHLVKNGGATPQTGDEVSYYFSMHKNDSLLGSTFGNPFPQKALIPDTSVFQGRIPPPDFEAIMLMSVGDSITIYNRMDIGPDNLDPSKFNETDIASYTLKLVGIKSRLQRMEEETAMKAQESKVAADITQTVKDYTAGKLNGELKSTESGLKYIIHEQGGGVQAAAGDVVKVNYYGVLTDGSMFDNSYRNGDGLEFPLGMGRVIQGWDEGIALMKEGDKGTLFIPYELAYGEAGSPPRIPAKAELVFFVELVSVSKAPQ